MLISLTSGGGLTHLVPILVPATMSPFVRATVVLVCREARLNVSALGFAIVEGDMTYLLSAMCNLEQLVEELRAEKHDIMHMLARECLGIM